MERPYVEQGKAYCSKALQKRDFKRFVSAQVGQWQQSAAADGAAPSPFSPDMGMLLETLPTPAPGSFGFAGDTGANISFFNLPFII